MGSIAEAREKFLKLYGRSGEEIARCREYVNRWWKKEAEHRLRIADEVRRQVFLFDLPWDMEQTAEPVEFAGEIDWMYQPGADPEFIYQLNRHSYWTCLGQAYAMTGDEEYARCFAGQLLHWIGANPITEETKPKTWRTIEAGLRGISWIRAMSYFAESPAVTDQVFEAFLDCLAVHGAYLAACDVPFSVKSNWGVLENDGLYAIGKLLSAVCGYPEAEGWAETAKKRLTRQIQVQVMDDGVHWEMSPMYHNEVLRCYLEALQTARLYGDRFPKIVEEKARAMAMADRIWQKPDGTQPAGGDSDETDLRDVLTACGYWFQDPQLKSGGFERLDYESLWSYGFQAAEEYERLESAAPEQLDYWLEDSGNWYLRSSWEKHGDYFHLRCGSLGGGHGHFDKGHFELVCGGEDLLIDPGRFTYVDGSDRRRFKSAAAHNTVTVDGEEYTRCLDSWGVEGLLPAVRGVMSRKGEYRFLECGHLGYMDRGVYVERRVLAIGTRIYVVMDTCYGSGEHTLRQHFHPAPGLSLQLGDHGFSLTGKRCRAEILAGSDGTAVSAESAEVSKHYNQKEPGSAVVFEKTGRGVFGMAAVIVCGDEISQLPEKVSAAWEPATAGMTGLPLGTDQADGLRIQAGEKVWHVVNAHVEAGASCEYIGAGGSFGLGCVMIAEEGQEDMTVLRW